ncbi:hypothetical protein PB2503_02597 [Parvularcula bermudensis HTCC2503]|uniref:Tyrosine specific protein phosphatases domain-containing protein n=1 Tax=Parvularcula bermudensis (strain ATCC BAA-594 / HTCC2503 / KCTC 12087) TaxID=314260 RepID=E0TCK7_PARBH|nr:hypothetical protein [Parvularcula bermudensis]ADM08596.1 hypothetical protein PB2503_02597 [Parvularcula bermudensis HTCC2503]
MADRMTAEEFATPSGRRSAQRALWLDDHGWLRTLYDNTHELPGGMRRTYQPSPGRIARYAQEGVKTLINLRGIKTDGRQSGVYWLEKEACEAAGIALVDLRAYSREAPKPEFLVDLDACFRSIAYPAVMHCKSGADRAGLAAVLYLFLKEGWPLEEALAQLTYRYGHVKSGKTGVLDHFFAVYREAARRDGVVPNRDHFLNWVETAYVRDEVTAGFTPGALGSLLTEVILRRE